MAITIQRVKETIKVPIEASLGALEQLFIAHDTQLTFAPIFIVAPPRSGSTLLYQLIARYFRVCYFSNTMTRFPGSPVCLARVLSLIGGCTPPDDYRSEYGVTEGGGSPTDGTKIWRRWFPDDPQYVGTGVLSGQKIREIRNTVAMLQKSFRAPFVSKTQRNNVRILALAEAFPEAKFIRLHRDNIYIVQSILRAIRNEGHNLWFSARPSRYKEIASEDIVEHVCEQIHYLKEDVDRDSKAVGLDRFLDLDYEELCRDPIKVMASISSFYEKGPSLGVLRRRNDIPTSFRQSSKLHLSDDEVRQIERYLEHLGTKPRDSAGSEQRTGPD